MSPEGKVSFSPPPDWKRTLSGREVTVVQTLANAFEQKGKISESDLLHAEDALTAIKQLKAKGLLKIKGDDLIPSRKFRNLFKSKFF